MRKNGWNLKFAAIAGAGILATGTGILIVNNLKLNETVKRAGNEQDAVMQTENRENNDIPSEDEKETVQSGQNPGAESNLKEQTPTDADGNSKDPEQEEESDGDDSKETQAPLESIRYEYDSLGRLITAEYQYYTVKYEYDGNGNILKIETIDK
ncbi:MAG: hypothetical protein ACI4AQ_06900 [Lachnospiraceae bacterium]